MTGPTTLPVQPTERIAILDALRGFALFGVVMSNLAAILYYSTPTELFVKASIPLDNVLGEIEVWIFEWKFITLFSMLFGYGFGLLIKRLEAKGISVVAFFTRRMALLFAMGLLNLCLWWADILHVYAIAGMMLLLFRRASGRTLLASAVVSAVILPWLVFTLRGLVFHAPIDPTMFHTLFPYFKSQNLLDIVEGNYRISYAANLSAFEIEEGLHAMGCILFGFWVLRKDVFARLEHYATTIRTICWVGLGCFVISIGFLLGGPQGWFKNPWIHYGVFPLHKATIIGPSLFYSTSLILLFRKGLLRGVFRAFANVGRLSLTNYLCHSLLYVFLFYGVGFNKLGEVSYHQVWPIGLAFYLLQVAFSAWWMKRFLYGPAEWVWRQLSYGRRFAIKRVPLNRTPSNG